MKLEEITSQLLSQAVGIYLRLAYGDSQPPEAVLERARLPEGAAGEDLMADERWERVPADAAPAEARRFNLRLGNDRYLHMKLGVDRVSDTEQFVLVVDTHDKHFAAMVQQGEQQAYRELLDHNSRLQQAIEQAWTAAGLPTFERYLRGRLTGLGRGGESEGKA